MVKFLKSSGGQSEVEAERPKLQLVSGANREPFARNIADTAGVEFFVQGAGSLMEQYAGVGEWRVNQLFDKAESHAPCVVFIDDVDLLKGGDGLDALVTRLAEPAPKGVVVIGGSGFQSIPLDRNLFNLWKASVLPE